MPLSLPPNFEKDIQGRDTNLVPLVRIGNVSGSYEDYIFISTNSITIVEDVFKPLLLNIPSLKESIDIEKRNYKISSVNLDISNFPYEGKRFSDLAANTQAGNNSLINTEVRIWWASPSGNIPYTDPSGTNDDSAMQIYSGTIRRYTHDDEKVRLVVEDRSQATLHKDLPLAYLGTGDDVPDKYKNKPIPMVYGHVDRSPCVISSLSDNNGDSLLLIDNDLSTSKLATGNEKWEANDKYNHSKLFLFDSLFADVPETTEIAMSTPSYTQWTNVGNKIIFPKIGESGIDEGGSGTLSDYNLIELHYIARPDRIKGYLDTDYEPNVALLYDSIQNPKHLLDDNPNNYLKISDLNLYSSWVGTQASTSPFYAGTLGFEFNNHLGLDFATLRSSVLINAQLISSNEGDPTIYMNWNLILWEDNFGFENYWLLSDDVSNSGLSQEKDGRYNNASNYDIPDATDLEVDINNSTPLAWNNLDDIMPANLWLVMFMNYGTTTQQPDIRVASIAYFIKGEYEYRNFAELDFYANVNGRGVFNTGQGLIIYPDASSVVADILEEVGYTGQIDFGSLPYNWEYAFTVDKKINSKKLIEGIASASPYIPRFNNMGEFKFTEIPISGGSVSPNHTIKEADCIDFSFSRTKIEDVYTKIEFKYNWDYAREEFNDSVEADTDFIEGYDPTYYGFKEIDGDIHAESTLTIDDDRGKYIRDHTTAQDFADWYLMWSCNQHLKMKVKLPLKYMNLEIGDLVDFDAILGGVNPYGINYTVTGSVNAQAVFKNFLITDTSKTLEWVEIECIQMHNLNAGVEYDCAGVAGGTTEYDECGVCGGDGETVGCGCDDYADGEYCNCAGDVLDECGECAGDSTSCMDECGIPNGDNTTCAGCMDGSAVNYDSDFILPCTYLEDYASDTQCCEYDEFAACKPFMDGGIIQHEGTSHSDIGDINIINGSDFGAECGDAFVSEEDIVIRLIRNDLYTVRAGAVHSVKFIAPIDDDTGDHYPNSDVTEVKLKLLTNEEHITILADEVVAELTEIAGGKKASFSFTTDADGFDLFRLEPENGEIEQRLYSVVFVFTITTYDHKYDREITYEEYLPVDFQYEDCTAVGDLNGDGNFNVLDIVTLANCVLTDTCLEIDYPCAADTNGDGGYNVLDIVKLANCVLAGTCEG